ncbi:MAG: M15 family metallopeptidase [Oscillospiraceae bacterium]|jgi:LAS superfamily LD-carboxypeptidase LdcB|nr:M15 family metallopeptidase [Oscillospiraceae bacterium]
MSRNKKHYKLRVDRLLIVAVGIAAIITVVLFACSDKETDNGKLDGSLLNTDNESGLGFVASGITEFSDRPTEITDFYAVTDGNGSAVTDVNGSEVTVKVDGMIDETGIVPPNESTSQTSEGTDKKTETSAFTQQQDKPKSPPYTPTYMKYKGKDIMVVNKSYPLPKTYNPGELESYVQSAFDEMKKAAKQDGADLQIGSGFRSWEKQNELYDKYVKRDGVAKADTYSARPGYSEHQSGLAFDLTPIDDSFSGTKQDLWLQENAHKFGFIVRFPKGKENITGYKYEPWHLRYVGKEFAEELHNYGLTLEEFFNIDSKYN